MKLRTKVLALGAECTVREWLRSQEVELLGRRVFTPTSVAELQMEALQTFLRLDVVFS